MLTLKAAREVGPPYTILYLILKMGNIPSPQAAATVQHKQISELMLPDVLGWRQYQKNSKN